MAIETARVVISYTRVPGRGTGGGELGGAGEATPLRTGALAPAGCCLERVQAQDCQGFLKG